MIRLILILGIISLVVWFVMGFITRKLKKIVSAFTSPDNKMNKEKDDEQVIYNKGDIVVMKGEASNPQDNQQSKDRKI